MSREPIQFKDIQEFKNYLENENLEIDDTVLDEEGFLTQLNENGLPTRLNQRLRKMKIFVLWAIDYSPKFETLMAIAKDEPKPCAVVYYDDADDINKYILRKKIRK